MNIKAKSLMRLLILGVVIASATVSVNAAPDLKDILKNAASKGSNEGGASGLDKLGSVLSGIVASSDFEIKDLEGDWQYQSPAVTFASDNALQKVGGAAAATAVEAKLEPYYEKAGLNALTLTVDAEGAFTMALRRTTLKGTVEKDEEGNLVFNFSALGKINLGKMKAHASKAGDTLSLTFDVSKLVSILKAVSSIANVSSLNTITSLLSTYDGIYAGFKLKAKN